jgi:hypothetical protein
VRFLAPFPTPAQPSPLPWVQSGRGATALLICKKTKQTKNGYFRGASLAKPKSSGGRCRGAGAGRCDSRSRGPCARRGIDALRAVGIPASNALMVMPARMLHSPAIHSAVRSSNQRVGILLYLAGSHILVSPCSTRRGIGPASPRAFSPCGQHHSLRSPRFHWWGLRGHRAPTPPTSSFWGLLPDLFPEKHRGDADGLGAAFWDLPAPWVWGVLPISACLAKRPADPVRGAAWSCGPGRLYTLSADFESCGGGFNSHFNLLRDVIGHFFVLVFIDHRARGVSKLPRLPPGG